ncbi:DUF4259 domain-containing protein [Arthrobacter sp. SAFR-179]|uniref:DUF4259 domain-containing protein n=1 Tax=Arthrobacter sp. SAFR-179 TaxID=3387279 RepID=UPI003F7B99A7
MSDATNTPRTAACTGAFSAAAKTMLNGQGQLWCLVRRMKLGTAVQVTPAVGGSEYPLLQNKQRDAPSSYRPMLALHFYGPPAPPFAPRMPYPQRPNLPSWCRDGTTNREGQMIGAWGYLPFENDDALDWLDELEAGEAEVVRKHHKPVVERTSVIV